MDQQDIDWLEGKYPSWQASIERNAKAAIDEIHQMAADAMPKQVELSAIERLIANSQCNHQKLYNYNPYLYINPGMQGASQASYYANIGTAYPIFRQQSLL